MSLDDIIKQNKGGKGGRGGGGGGSGRRGRGAGVSPRRGARGSPRAGGGVMRGRNRGGISRSSAPYTRVSFCTILFTKRLLKKVRNIIYSSTKVFL